MKLKCSLKTLKLQLALKHSIVMFYINEIKALLINCETKFVYQD